MIGTVNKSVLFLLLMVSTFAVYLHISIQEQQRELLKLNIEHRQLEIRYLKLQLELLDESAVLTTR
ncbi:hypothetical protein C1S99_08190 [Vibrio parahaemolyticus]|uniref:hypothetical protein n=1 Tax=Vibrio parahaemolyticus TaxID=670 RepID=UPI0004712057|nr:hypothetical protein [Vibrio parahaemolyticus]EHK0750582.1 hypothetical protein [Vibrio parahaemolyticus]EJE4178498.1 hypothetical protein [Vibrio parahaemolyticus]EKH9212818.1 hypothetical protein [Vibrio parahaemolyticus]EKQ5898149.1 hypothetical protein [Vibrio parahaemolyticus]ELZ7199847.1 hypothetical protein [Vibrio parahaemolyticus]